VRVGIIVPSSPLRSNVDVAVSSPPTLPWDGIGVGS